MRKPKIPEAAIRRLPVYLRVLEATAKQEIQIISSAELAQRTGFSPEQIRKDLAYFGAFGTRGVGYDTVALSRRISRILGLHQGVNAVLVGAGYLGHALARYSLARHKDIKITAIFDADPKKVGTEIGGIAILPIDVMSQVCREKNIRIGIIAVPGTEAQATAERLQEAGIEAILNFAPGQIRIAPEVFVQNIDLTLELQSLAYYTSASEVDEAQADQ